MIVSCVCVCSPHGTVGLPVHFVFLHLCVLSFLIKLNTLDTTHAAYWFDPCFTSSEEEKCTWEEILDGRGPWAQRRPKAELEAAKAERRWYEEAAWRRGWKPESQLQKCNGGWHTEYGEAR